MTICPHARRMDLPCPYPGCHASCGGTEVHRVKLEPMDPTLPAQYHLLYGPDIRRESFRIAAMRLVIADQESIRWTWLPA